MLNKRGTANWFPVVMTVAVVLILYQMGVFAPFLGSAKGGSGATGGTGGGAISVNITGQQCNVDSTTLTLGNVEGYYTGAKLSTYYHRWWLNGVDQGYVLDGTTKTVAPGDDIRVIYNLNGSATSFYPVESKFKIPCTGAFTAATADDTYKDAYKLYNMSRATDVNFVINNQNSAPNSASAPQALTAGQTRKMKWEIDFPNRAGFGSPGDASSILMMCFRNTTYIQDLQQASGKAKYTGAVPSRIGVTPGFSVEAWDFPGQTSNGILTDSLVVTADPTNPTTATNMNINCTLVDKAWFPLINTPGASSGYQKDDSVTDTGSVDLSMLFRTNGTG